MCKMYSHVVFAALFVSLIGTSHSHDCHVYGELRLIPYDEQVQNEGRIEICSLFGTWYMVGGNEWDNNDAAVACRQLNYSAIGAIAHVEEVEEGQFLIDRVGADGTEEGLLKSPHVLVNGHNTVPRPVAGVRCFIDEDNDPECNYGDIRLVDGVPEYNGTVQVCVNKTWGSVCHDDWDTDDANVVCKQLGHLDTGSRAIVGSYFGDGTGDVPIYLDDIECEGSETKLITCQSNPIKQHSCSRSELAGVNCKVPADCEDGDLRLVDGKNKYEGRLEICFDRIWGTVCDDYFDENDAAVACRQLGHVSINPEVHHRAHFGQGGLEQPIYLDNVACSGEEKKLISCPANPINDHNCLHEEDVGITCQVPICKHGQIRLANGGNVTEGRVEVCIDGLWGTICSDNWGAPEAMVACYQLGYYWQGAVPTHQAAFGEGEGYILLDRLSCTGKELSIANCSYQRTVDGSCSHSRDAGVICQDARTFYECKTGDVRLFNGSSPLEGTVEVCVNNAWGTVCDDSWDYDNAGVVCRQLGYSRARAKANGDAHFGIGRGDIHLDDVRCTGSESRLLDCPSNPITTHNCNHGEDAGVICEETDDCQPGKIRLANGGNVTEGRVEVCIEGDWGTICDGNWGAPEAMVACYQLGYYWQGAVPIYNAAFGEGSGTSFLDGISCTGKELSIANCSYERIVDQSCSHSNDVGVICQDARTFFECETGDVRLFNGSSPREGTVEVCVNNAWGTVCDNSWDDLNAGVVCQEVGYLRTRAKATSNAQFGIGHGDIHLDNVHCTGSENHLLDCPSNPITTHNCNHREDAGVICAKPVPCEEGELRPFPLNKTEGTVEICHNRDWWTICDHTWDDKDAAVACGQLGYSTRDAVARTRAHFGPGDEEGPIILNDIDCSGTESTLSSCFVQPVGGRTCRHSEDAGVSCIERCDDGDIRLVNGLVSSEGMVEFCIDDEWGTICDDDWTVEDAAVVCHQLGYPRQSATVFNKGSAFGERRDKIFAHHIVCSGTEAELYECLTGDVGSTELLMSGTAVCNSTNDVGVRCYSPCDDGDIRLVRDNYNCEFEGTVEICIDDTWGTVCDDSWDDADAKVVCNQLGYTSASATTAYSSAHFGEGSGVIYLDDVHCTGTEANLLLCNSNPIGQNNCYHRNDAGVSCKVPEDCMDGELRLKGGSTPSEGRVEVCFDKEWGTVCDDSWDINDAMVVCAQLNFSSWGISAVTNAGFGEGTCSIFLDDVGCTGNEESLINCSHPDIGDHNCHHYEDAGVVCKERVCTDGDVRLAPDPMGYEGTVEYCRYGVWGTVCERGWTKEDAAVTCAQLGFPREGAVVSGSATSRQFGEGVFLVDVECIGNEASLKDCPSDGPGRCSNNQVAEVRCIPNINGTVCDDGDVRLVNGTICDEEGRVEICINNTWGTVCDDNWDINDAGVVCGQLGYSGIAKAAHQGGHFYPGTGPIYLDDLQCSGAESSLLSCSSPPINTHDCSHSEDAGATCQPIECDDGDVRLIPGEVDFEGRIEYCHYGIWGTVCDDGWSAEDAAVACYQLGFPRKGAVAFGHATFGSGSGEIFRSDVECNGEELSLYECSSGDADRCSHSEDAGVRCIKEDTGTVCGNGQVRLVDGIAGANEGRVEICINNTWGTVCDDDWDTHDAKVVCNQLGHSSLGAIAYSNAYFGSGSGPISLDQVQCSGTEEKLLSCFSNPVYSHNCDHSDDAGVFCKERVCTDGEVRLVYDSVDYEGRVEYCLYGAWGTVCSVGWTDEDAAVVCAQLGFSREGAMPFVDAAHGEGSGEIFLKNVECTGNEASLKDCPHSDPYSCGHDDDAGVRCIVKKEDAIGTVCNEGQVRLVDGDLCAQEGRVEICINNTWGTVCDDRWDEYDAAVVCGQLGFSTDGAIAYSTAHFGRGTGPITLDEVHCIGAEKSILSCSSRPLYSHDCDHSEDAGASCKVERVIDNSPCQNGDIRLAGGASKSEGRVEVCYNHTWGTVCDDHWDAKDAKVVCKQLGYRSTEATAYLEAHFGAGSGDIFLDDVVCTGSEDSLFNCPSLPIMTHNCQHSEDAGVACTANVKCKDGQVQLLDGDTCSEGRVEICLNNEWGTVCDDHWETTDAMVICSQLGFSPDGAVPTSEFGHGTGPVVLDDVLCTGDESTILDCTYREFGYHNCYRHEDIGVKCKVPDDFCEDGKLRLSGGSKDSEGRVEVCVNNRWGSVCDDSWGANEAKVVCSQLGFSPNGAEPITDAEFGPGVCSIVLDDVDCTGDESSLLDCGYRGQIGCHDCHHSEDAGVRCEVEPRCKVELINKDIRGTRVEISFSTTDDITGTKCLLDPPETFENLAFPCDKTVLMHLSQASYVLWIYPTNCGGLEDKLEIEFEVMT